VTALYCSCERAEKAKIQAREAVVLLEHARMLLSEDNAVQLAMQHTDEAIREADRRAAMLVLQPQLAMEGSSSAAVVTAFGPHLVTSSPARPV
jgi:hypothetical protein